MSTVRLAAEGEAATLHAIAREAYQRYVPRIGREPAPMSADYAAAVRSGQAWVAVDRGEVIGLMVLVAQPDHLLVENLAIRPSTGCSSASASPDRRAQGNGPSETAAARTGSSGRSRAAACGRRRRGC
jgi:hypothetical protein